MKINIKYKKKLLCNIIQSYTFKGNKFLKNPNEKSIVWNEVNWNILLASGNKIKRDSVISVNKSREV